jgi:O-antigen/teichoic acid export membrane protein
VTVRRALLLTTADRYFSMIVNFLMIAVASRLFTPAEFGVSVIGVAIIGLAVAARDLVPPNYLIQKRDMTTDDVRAAFSLMMLVTLPIATGLALAAPSIERAYAQPGLAPYLLLIAAMLTIEPFQTTIQGVLRREMKFGRVALMNITNVTVNALVLVALALAGASFEAFGWALLAASVATNLVAFACRPEPGFFAPTRRGWRDVLRFGGYNVSAALLYRTYESIPFLLFARILPLHAVGLLQRMWATVQLPDKFFLSGVMSVALPHFSRLSRDGQDLKQIYLRAVELITALQWPALAMLAVLAHPIVAVLLGDQWTAAVPLIQIAAIAWMFSFSNELNFPILVVHDAMRENLMRAAIIWPVSGAALVAAATHGAMAVACALLIVIPFQAIVSVLFVKPKIGVRLTEVVAATARSALVTLAAIAGPCVWALARGDWAFTIPEALVCGAMAAIGWLAAIWLTRHPLRGEIVRAAGLARARLAPPRANPAGANMSAADE